VNSGFEYREEIGAGSAGLTVLAYLAARYRHSSEEAWRDRIERGEVRLGGATAGQGDLLAAGAVLTWRRPPWEEPAVPLSFAVLFRDADLLAVAKPAGLPSVPNGGFLEHTLLHRVQRRFPEATALHRLGRGTSGLVLFARSDRARRALAAAWRRGEVKKLYRALVAGRPEEDEFTVAAPIGPVPHPTLGQVHAANPQGKPAVSHVRVLCRRDSDSLVEVAIPTGRPHQIRIHLAAAGHPLVGDPLYVAGGVPGPDAGRPGDLGYRLHACRLSFAHPATGAPVVLECAAPPALSLASCRER
jgi:23S rRNA pseudouridine1911/1915/1917 synthase